MKRKLLSISSVLVFTIHFSLAQNTNVSSLQGEKSYGIGYGLPYGGIGLKVGYNLMDGLNAFAGVGYQTGPIGYNIGLQKDLVQSGMVQPYVSAMFGSNAAIRLIGTSYDERVFLGPSVGAGVKINALSHSYQGNYLELGVIYAFTSVSYQEEFESIKNSSLANKLNEPWPVLIVIGYNFHF